MQNENIVLIRAFVREGLARHPVEMQELLCREIAEELELPLKVYRGRPADTLKTRDAWCEQIRSDEIAVVSELWLLKLTRKQLKGRDPKADFASAVASITAAYVLEASTGLQSIDTRKWRTVVEAAINRKPPGARTLTSEQASAIARKGWKQRRGIVELWRSRARENERYHLVRHWRSASSAAAAYDGLKEFISRMGDEPYNELSTVSVSTLRRICNGD